MTLPAGRDLDAVIAEKVMGDAPCDRHGTYGECFHGMFGREYSTDIAAAWAVVERVGICVWPTVDGRWYAFADRFDTAYGREYYFGGAHFIKESGRSVCATAAEAICRAALIDLQP